MKLHRRLINIVSRLVPRRWRSDWKQEWDAELEHRESRLESLGESNTLTKWDLLRRSSGSVWDAIAMQPRRLEEDLVQDVYYGLRLMWRHKGWTLVAVLTLALGIGSTTAIFSVVNAVMLQPLPFPDPDRIVRIDTNAGLAIGDIPVMRAQATVLDNLSTFRDHSLTLTGVVEPVRLTGAQVSPSIFPLLGASPILGRVFEAVEERPGNDHVVLLSGSLWERYFQSDPDVIGRPVALDDDTYIVVGIMPNAFGFPNASTQYWVPFTAEPPVEVPGGRLSVSPGPLIARVADGVSIDQAAAEIETIVRGFALQSPNGPPTVAVASLQDELVAPVRPALLVLMGAVGLVLLIACSNVANLTLTRASGRRREIAIRVALGAGRARILRQVLSESVVLAIIGGALGAGIAYISIPVLMVIQPGDIPRIEQIGIDTTVLAFALGVSLLTGILVGLAPAFRLARFERAHALKDGGDYAPSGSRLFGRTRMRGLLTISEVALSVILLVGAGLLIRSFSNLAGVDRGYDPENVLTLAVDLPSTRYAGFPQQRALYDGLLERIRAIEGIESAGAVSGLPLNSALQGVGFEFQGGRAAASLRTVSPGYLESMNVRLVEGRFHEVSDRDGLIVVNEAFAAELFPEGAVGREFDFGPVGNSQIIGVVENTRSESLDSEVSPEAYLNYTYAGALSFAQPPRMLAIRSSVEPSRLVPAIRNAVLQLDDSLPLADVRTMEDRIDTSIVRPRFYAAVLGLFAGVALAMASVGIYGVLAYRVTQRTREIGIRVAMGAERGTILKMILSQGLFLTAAGVAVGLVGALFLTRYLEAMLFGLTPLDPVTFVGMTGVLFLTTFVACYVPARRATEVDPLVALRHE